MSAVSQRELAGASARCRGRNFHDFTATSAALRFESVATLPLSHGAIGRDAGGQAWRRVESDSNWCSQTASALGWPLVGSFESLYPVPMKVLGICGALSAQSANREAIRWAQQAVPAGMTLTEDAQLGRLPLFNPDLETMGQHPDVHLWRQSVGEHDALLILCPEYGFSLPGVLKNGIDWLIGSGELENKRVATTAIVAGVGRGLRGLEALSITLGAVSARVCGQKPIVRGNDVASVERIKVELRALLEQLKET